MNNKWIFFERFVYTTLGISLVLGIIISFLGFISFNGVGDLFQFRKLNESEVSVEKYIKKDVLIMEYTCTVNNKSFSSYERMHTKSLYIDQFNENNIYYNATFPFLSYVGNIELMQSSMKMGMKIFTVFGLIFLSIYLFKRLKIR